MVLKVLPYAREINKGCYAVFIQQRGRSDTTTLKDVRRTYRTSAKNNLSGRKDRSSAAWCTRVVDNNTIGSEVGCVYSGTVIAFKIQALNMCVRQHLKGGSTRLQYGLHECAVGGEPETAALVHLKVTASLLIAAVEMRGPCPRNAQIP